MTFTWDITGLYNAPARKLRFALNLVQLIAEQQPGRQFSLVFHHTIRMPEHLSGNLSLISVKPPRNRLFLKLWYRSQLMKILQQNNSSLLVSFNCNVNVSLPVKQIRISWDEESSRVFINQDQSGNHMPQSETTGKNSSGISNDVTQIQPAADPVYKPVSLQEAGLIKNHWTKGKEYFFCKNCIHGKNEFIFLLKSFSHFKKRQKSEFRLLVHVNQPGSFEKLLSTYKYRSDVDLLEFNSVEEFSQVCAAAYGVILTHASTDIVNDILESMQCGVPVIAPAIPGLTELPGDAVLNFEIGNDAGMGEKMMRLYTDESHRSQLINRGTGIARLYSFSENANAVWKAILNPIG